MRIAFLTHSYPRFEGDIAGVFLERLAVALIARGHDVRVVAPADVGKGGDEVRNGVPITWIRYAPAASETLAYRGTMLAALRSPAGLLWFGNLMLRQARAVASLRAARGLDIVHAHWWVPGGVSARLARGRYVVTLHGMDVVLLESSAWARAVARPVLSGAAAITAVSSNLAERIAACMNVPLEAIVTQPMPIEMGGFSRTSKGGGGVVTVGRLMPRKRLDVLLEAMVLLHNEGRSMPLTIIGDGPERQRLERLTQRLELADHVRFLGALPPERVAAAVGDADVFAFPAMGEGFGLAAAEALLLGVPLVGARDGGGVRDIVPKNGAGRLVDANAPNLARAIAELAADPDAKRLAREAGDALRRRLEPAAAAEFFESLYARVAAPQGLA